MNEHISIIDMAALTQMLPAGYWLYEIGYPHLYLTQDQRLYNAKTNEWTKPQPSGEIILWNIDHTAKHRINFRHLYSYMFHSPRRVWGPGFWMNMAPLGFSQYEITYGGEVYSLKTYAYMIPQSSFDGYQRVCLTDDNNKSRTMVISRLVAMMFIPNPEHKLEVNHKNGNKLDNSVPNLEWVFAWENTQHALDTGLRKRALTDEQIHEICRLLQEGVSVSEIMRRLGVPKHAVLGIKSGCHARISQHYNIPKNRHF